MSKTRTDLITKAFRKLDRDGSGELTIDDLRGVYNGKKHPKYLNGQWTEDQVLSEWLSSFAGPGKTFDGVVIVLCFILFTPYILEMLGNANAKRKCHSL